MARNIYFSDNSKSEQGLYEDIVIEALKIYGQDMYYLPRDIVKTNDLLNEDPSSRFNSSYMIEMYVDNVEGFDGQGDLFSKFGVEIRDAVTLTMARRRWKQAVKRYDNELEGERPMEGDLIFIPFSRKLFQIVKVEHEAPFYQLNNLPTYKLQCELFEFSGDDFDTGVAVIDEIERSYAYKYIIEFQDVDNARARAYLDSNEQVDLISVTNNGVGYTSVPIVTVTPPTLPARQAAVTLLTNNDNIIGVDVTDSGRYYTSPPVLVFPEPTPTPPFKFGDRALYHDSGSKRTIIAPPSVREINPVANRVSVRFWYWAGELPTEDKTIIRFGPAAVYHRATDNKIVLYAGTGPGEEAASTPSCNIYDSAADSGYWNFISVEILNNSAKVIMNYVDGTVAYTSSAINFPAGSIIAAGADPDTVVDSSITKGFVGYIDHISINETGDQALRDPDPVPLSVLQQEVDGDVLVRARNVATFNNIQAAGYATVTSGGKVDSVVITSPGTGYPDSSYNITVSAPTGTPADFTATAFALIDSAEGTVTDVGISFNGGGYTDAPTVTIAPQGLDLTFEVGEKVYQTLANGVVISGEVSKYSDSDFKLHLINIGADDGNYHEFTTGLWVNRDSANGPKSAKVYAVSEVNQLSETEQNETFATNAATFLDFSETNPFGDPS
jgi:hypothetical protein